MQIGEDPARRVDDPIEAPENLAFVFGVADLSDAARSAGATAD